MAILFTANENYSNGLLSMDRLLFNKAERYFNKALSYAPSNAEYYARLGELYAHRSRFEKDQQLYQGKSVDLYRKALSISPYDGNLHIETAIAYARYGRKNEAADELRKAISLDPNNTFYRNTLVQYSFEWGDLNTAEEEFKKALLIKGR
jgi:Flp pilus assembly protein TadD